MAASNTVMSLIAIMLLLSCGSIGWTNQNNVQMLPETSKPFTYFIYYMWDYFTDPGCIERFQDSPPDLLHVGKAVPITHHWGPVGLYKGENQYTGGPNWTLSRDNIKLLSPADVEERVLVIKNMLKRYHDIGIDKIIPYISYNTIAGEHETREGFWEFYDNWQKYSHWAGPPLKTDPYEWMIQDENGEFIGLNSSWHTPSYFAPLHRYRTCINHPDWAEWHRRLVRMTAQIGYDGCFLDNAHTDLCFCPYCQESFKRFLKESQDIHWVKRMTHNVSPEDYDLSNPKLSVLRDRWRWLCTRDHLGKLRDVGRKINPEFTIYPNHNRMESALIAGQKCDLIMFESSTIPGVVAPDGVENPVLTIKVNQNQTEAEKTKLTYMVNDSDTRRELLLEFSVTTSTWIGNETKINVTFKEIGVSKGDNDMVEDVNLILKSADNKEQKPLRFSIFNDNGSVLTPKQLPKTFSVCWVPEKAGEYEIFIQYRYIDGGEVYDGVKSGTLDRIEWKTAACNHLAEMLFTQHMAARTIYHSRPLLNKVMYENRKSEMSWIAWDNVQELALAEAAAFSGGGTFSSAGPAQAVYTKFFDNHSFLYEGWRQYAPAAILYSVWGGNPLSDKDIESESEVHDSLWRSGRLFTALVDSTISANPDELSAYEVIYLPSLNYELKQEQINALNKYVQQGGNIVITNDKSQISGHDTDNVFGVDKTIIKHEIGKGNVVFNDSQDILMPTDPVSDIRNLPENLIFASYKKEDKLCLQAVNYHVYLLSEDKKIVRTKPFTVSIPLPHDWQKVSATAYAPLEVPKKLDCKVEDNKVYFSLPSVRIYKVIYLEKLE